MSSFIKANQGLSLAIAAMTIVSVAAVAQTTNSPFASKKKTQAWETDAARPDAQTPTYQAPTYQAPTVSVPNYIPPPNYTAPADIVSAPSPTPTYRASTPQTYRAPSDYSAPSVAASAPSYNEPKSYTAPTLSQSEPILTNEAQSFGSYVPQNSVAPNASKSVVAPDLLPGFRRRDLRQSGSYNPGGQDSGGFSVPAYAPRQQTAQNKAPQRYNAQKYSQQNYGGAYAPPQQNKQYQSDQYQNGQYQSGAYQSGSNVPPQTAGPNTAGPNSGPQYGRQSWKDRLGLNNLLTTFSGVLKAGIGALDRTNTIDNEGLSAGYVVDGKLSGEVSAITQGGLEYGIGGEVRGQYDRFRRGFGGLVGDCGPGVVENVPGCNTLIVDGLVQPLRGHTSQFYSAGSSNAQAAEIAVEGAYLFLRSAYGDVTIGRDDGAAYLFSLGAPTLLAVNASNSPVDYTGLDSVRTVNEASGFSEKIAYVSPRLLGDQIGVGIQFGASYALDARACGVDYCVRSNGADDSTALSPDLEDVLEFGLALDRTFSNGLSIEGTATYARANEVSGLVFPEGTGFDDLRSFGLGLEAKYGAWTLGGSFLNSNNGLEDGDYEAYDIGLTYKPGKWGVSASYGHATDKNVNLLSDQGTLGFIYDFEKFTLGTGVQYIERDVVGIEGGLFTPRRERAGALFIEGGIKF